jgi:hypothetical protein
MKYLGIILIIWGLADFVLSLTGIDLYMEIGIQLPQAIYPFTPLIASVIGYVLYSSGKPSIEE